jgi:CDP-glycerol glycerophosphotransferase (TagB/SpsB family)
LSISKSFYSALKYSVLGQIKLNRRKLRLLIVKVLAPFFIKNKSKYLCVSKAKYGYRCNIRLIAEELSSEGKNVFLFYEGNTSNELKKILDEQGIVLLNKFNISSLFHILTSANVVIGHSIRDAYISQRARGRKVINLWHGVPIKAIEMAMPYNEDPHRQKLILKNAKIYDSMIASSHIDRLAMASSFGISPRKVFVTGLPRYDYLTGTAPLANDLQRMEQQLITALNGRKLILYAPTFRETTGNSAFNDEVVQDLITLNNYCTANNLILGIRSHIADQIGQKFVNNNILNLNADVISETNLLLRHVDCLITDFSSIWVDYLLLDRPIIGYAKDYKDYLTKERGFLYPFFDIFPAPFHSQVSDIIQSIDDLLTSHNWEKTYQKQKDIFHQTECTGSSYTQSVVNQAILS